jgi:hypothetical protein
MCRSLLLCLLLVGPGCSYAFVHGPSARYETPSGPEQGVSCTTSNAAPAVDTVLAIPFILAGGAGIVGAVEMGQGCTGKCSYNIDFGSSGEWLAVGIAALAIGTLYVSSAVTGYGRTADCRRLQETLPGPPRRSERHLLDVQGIAEARARSDASTAWR